jgi:hypothetical protein
MTAAGRFTGLSMILAIIAFVGMPIVSAAARPGTQGTYEQRRACRADAMRFCRDYVPNVRRITACMEKNVARLSPACRAQFR